MDKHEFVLKLGELLYRIMGDWPARAQAPVWQAYFALAESLLK